MRRTIYIIGQPCPRCHVVLTRENTHRTPAQTLGCKACDKASRQRNEERKRLGLPPLRGSRPSTRSQTWFVFRHPFPPVGDHTGCNPPMHALDAPELCDECMVIWREAVAENALAETA